MQIKENSEEILIKHIPVKEWVIGGILSFITFVLCLSLLYVFFISPNGSSVPIIGDWAKSLPGLVVGVVFILMILDIKTIRTPLTTVIIDGKTERIDIMYRRFYGERVERFYFYQIEKFKSYKKKINFSQKYFLTLVLANRKTIKLHIPIGNDQQETTKFIKKLNKFIKTKKLPDK